MLNKTVIYFFNKFKLTKYFFLFTIIILFIIISKPVFEGAVPFWYDPARDLLMAWDNLHKITLIGPTSGIPGIFYGPHWIWLLSIGLLLSKDPRWILLTVITIPYFIVLPLLIFKLKKENLSDVSTIAILILTFFSLSSYITQIWSPHLAPLFLFCILTLFYLTKDLRYEKNIRRFLFIGILHGMLFNHHISFGVVMSVAWVLYLSSTLVMSILKKDNRKKHLQFWFLNSVSFGIGFFLTLLPFFIFEIRHGFLQLKSLLFTLSQTSSVVGQVGLSKLGIIQKFIERSYRALSLFPEWSIPIILFLGGGITWNYFKRKIYSKDDIKLLVFLLISIIALFMVYFGTKNPVWDYHFITVEVLFLFLLILAIKKNKIFEISVFLWACILMFSHFFSYSTSFIKQKKTGELLAKKATVSFIYNDAKDTKFAYFAKNPSIYSFDYDYLFRWVGESNRKTPLNELDKVDFVYLIIPDEMKSDKVGFTENRTPKDKYETVSEWVQEDNTLIIKRKRII